MNKQSGTGKKPIQVGWRENWKKKGENIYYKQADQSALLLREAEKRGSSPCRVWGVGRAPSPQNDPVESEELATYEG